MDDREREIRGHFLVNDNIIEAPAWPKGLSKETPFYFHGEVRALLSLLDVERKRADELMNELTGDRAVCICGCPPEAHESYGEEGEACEHDDHECLRVCVAVRNIVASLRARADAEYALRVSMLDKAEVRRIELEMLVREMATLASASPAVLVLLARAAATLKEAHDE